MDYIYKIPLNFKFGEFKLNELPKSKEYITITLGEFGVLTCHSESGREIRNYDVDRTLLESTMNIKYRTDGSLEYIEHEKNDFTYLIYINFYDENNARDTISKYAAQNGEWLANDLIKMGKTLCRLFADRFFDGEAFSYSILPCTEEEVQKMRGFASNHPIFKNYPDFADNSGNYPSDNRMRCDEFNIGIMLQCVPYNSDYNYFNLVCNIMSDKIKNIALPKINETDDFKFIDEEYD